MNMLAVKHDETPDVEYVKERLEQAGYALQCLPADKPRGFSVAWPDIPRTSLEAWILQVQAERDTDAKKSIAREALRFRRQATADQIAALDAALDWLYVFIKCKNIRGIVLARSMVFGENKKRVSYRKLGKSYGVSHEYARILYEKGIGIIAENLNA